MFGVQVEVMCEGYVYSRIEGLGFQTMCRVSGFTFKGLGFVGLRKPLSKNV